MASSRRSDTRAIPQLSPRSSPRHGPCPVRRPLPPDAPGQQPRGDAESLQAWELRRGSHALIEGIGEHDVQRGEGAAVGEGRQGGAGEAPQEAQAQGGESGAPRDVGEAFSREGALVVVEQGQGGEAAGAGQVRDAGVGEALDEELRWMGRVR